ncbi:MAG TPA: hypothetical protein VE988_12190 [Gemmataceae bacterium]|nr:hypothetical protein [Gemmataceae bacterium]
MPDPLDDFLDRSFSCDPPEGLQIALRQKTTRMLTRQRWLRRLALAGAAAACYVAGLATMWLIPPRTTIIQSEPPPNPPVVIVEKQIEQPLVVDVNQPEKAIVYEWKAHDEPNNRAANFFKAGDLYLVQENDAEGALRCYRQALDAGGLQALELTPDDTWLVSALKNARLKERIHED